LASLDVRRFRRFIAEPLLNRIHAEIRARLRECEAAVRESERLDAALVALGADETAPAGSPSFRDAAVTETA
jgi:hypothetical protein